MLADLKIELSAYYKLQLWAARLRGRGIPTLKLSGYSGHSTESPGSMDFLYARALLASLGQVTRSQFERLRKDGSKPTLMVHADVRFIKNFRAKSLWIDGRVEDNLRTLLDRFDVRWTPIADITIDTTYKALAKFARFSLSPEEISLLPLPDAISVIDRPAHE